MSYRTRVMVLGGMVALPLLLLAVVSALRVQADQERALIEERVAIARAVAAAADGVLDSNIAAVRAITALSTIRDFPNQDGDSIEQAMRPLYDAFPNVETLGLMDLDGWNVRSITNHLPVPPRSVNVSDRQYFIQAVQSRQVVVGSAVLSRIRAGVPVVAIAVPVLAPGPEDTAPLNGVLVGTVALGQLRDAIRSALPDPRLSVVMVDREGQALVLPDVAPEVERELQSLRGLAAVDAVLAGSAGSRRVRLGEDGEEVLVTYAPVQRAGWGVLVQQPAEAALAPSRQQAVGSLLLLVLALGLSFGMAWFLATRLARSHQQVEDARRAAERGRERAGFLAEWSHRLAATLDYEETLQAAARLSVPVLADWCMVDVVENGATGTRRLAVANTDQSRAALARALQDRQQLPRSSAPGVARVLTTGEPLLVEQVTESYLVDAAADDEHLRLLRELAPRSLMVVPLRGRGGMLGTILFIVAESARRYEPDDLQFARQVADHAALAVENARLYADAQQALRLRDEFLAAASHDLKSPLTTMKAQAQLLRRRASREGSVGAEDVVKASDRIEATASRTAAMVDELLDVARLELGQPLDLAREPTDLAQLAAEALADVESLAPNIRLRLEEADEPLVGEWDARRLRRVLDNLLGNAIKYSPEGGEVVVRMSSQDDYASLVVTDHGIGIPRDDLPRLFARFQRGANVVGRIAGTGIGLASAHHIVTGHGGSITIESQEGKGTAVQVRLPLARQPVVEPGTQR